MQIINLDVKRYKSIEHLEMKDLKGLCVLVGENGSGKTNILELLLLFFKEFSQSGRTSSQLTPEHWYKREQSQPIEIHIDLKFNQSELDSIFGESVAHFVSEYLAKHEEYLSISGNLTKSGQWDNTRIMLGEIPLHSDGMQIEIHEFLQKIEYRITTGPVYFTIPGKDDVIMAQINLETPYLMDEQRKEVYRLESDLLDYTNEDEHIHLGLTYKEWVEKEEIVSSNIISMDSYKIQNINQNLNSLINLLRSSLKIIDPISKQPLSPVRNEAIPSIEIKEILSFYNSQDGSEQEIWFNFKDRFEKIFGGRLIRVNGLIQYELNQRRYSLDSIGGGHSSWFRLLWQISNNSNQILLLEEPESHMHPGLSKSVGHFLRESALMNQILFTTHSTVFLDQCNYDEIWLAGYSDSEGTKAKRIENYEELRDIAYTLGISPSDILYSNNLLFLEGQSDKNYIQAAAKLMDVILSPTRVSIIPFEGSGKGRFYLKVFREAAVAAQRPFYILLDGDVDAKNKAKELVDDKLVIKDQILNLSKRDIEDYYSENLFFDALNEEYAFTSEESDMIKAAISKEKRTKEIDRILYEKRGLKNGVWKIPVSEYMSAKMELQDIDEEIRIAILKIDRFFRKEEAIQQ